METPVSLLERIRQPASADWPRFVDLYTPILFDWAHRLGARSSDAADLVQDVFAVLVVELPRFQYDPARSFRGWLMTILRNTWRKRLRRPAGLPLDHVAEPAARADDVGEAEYRQHLAGRALELMRADFDPTTWKAFYEVVVNGRGGDEVAREFGMKRNAMYQARSRVLRRLREELDGLWE